MRTKDGMARLEEVRRQFEHWRRTRERRTRIPEPLWTTVEFPRRAEPAFDAKDYGLLKMLVDAHAYLAELGPTRRRASPGSGRFSSARR